MALDRRRPGRPFFILLHLAIILSIYSDLRGLCNPSSHNTHDMATTTTCAKGCDMEGMGVDEERAGDI